MQYQGGKAAIGKALAVQMLGQVPNYYPFVDLFCGACGVLEHVPATRLRIANDINPYMIALWRAVTRGWEPPSKVSRETYAAIKASPEHHPPELVAFVATACSFGGKWWGGYASNAQGHDYAGGGMRGVARAAHRLRGTHWIDGDYRDVPLPPVSVVYADPPYAGTTAYRATSPFDVGAFWEHMRLLVSRGLEVFVSEYTAPADWVSVWSRRQTKMGGGPTGKGKDVTEHLFRHRTQAPSSIF